MEDSVLGILVLVLLAATPLYLPWLFLKGEQKWSLRELVEAHLELDWVRQAGILALSRSLDSPDSSFACRGRQGIRQLACSCFGGAASRLGGVQWIIRLFFGSLSCTAP